jgi:hypothetical protein
MGQVDLATGTRARAGEPRRHVDDLDAEAVGLLALVPVHGADTDLDQAYRQSFLHDARERAGVGVAVALEHVVQVGVRVDVEDGKRRDRAGHPAHRGIGDRVVAAQRDRPAPGADHLRDTSLDQRSRLRRRR